MPRVNIDGYEYVPKPDTFLLTLSHFDEAAKTSNPFELVKWAFENQESVAAMLAWGRSKGITTNPTKARKLDTSHLQKPLPSLFAEVDE